MISPFCNTIWTYVDIDLDVLHDDPPIGEPEAPDTYRICREGFEKTKFQMNAIINMPFREVPLYIADDNLFVRHAVKNRLEKGI